MESFTKGIEQIKINDEYYFGDNLSYELDFLKILEKKLRKKFLILNVLFILARGQCPCRLS